MAIVPGRTFAIYGDSGSGKTTQAGELAKWHYRRNRKRTRYNRADLGGSDSIRPMITLGIMDENSRQESDDPWKWIADVCSGEGLTDDIGLTVIDSGTSVADDIMLAITKAPAQIGTQKTQKFRVADGLTVGVNNESHYMLVQGFMLDMIWKSTWLTQRGVDVLWTFATHRGENPDSEPIVGPKLVGKALTPVMPRWFNYTFRIAQATTPGGAPTHSLFVQAQPGSTGTSMSFGNARYPMDATTELPAVLTPASLPAIMDLIDAGQVEAEQKLREELGL